MYVLDTNTVIYFFKGMGRVAEKLLQTPPAQISLPAIVIYELQVGAEKSKAAESRLSALQKFANTVTILPFAENQAIASAGIRTRLEKQGKSIGPLDLLIAGTALAFNGTLVTHNTKEFSRVPGLKLDDWF